MNDSSIIETAARALNHEGWTCLKGADEPGHYDECEDCKRVCDDVARAVIAAIHPTVSTIEELEALPIQSIVACMGLAPGTRNVPVTLVWQRGSVDNGGSDWCMPDTQGQITASDVFYFLTVNQLRQELTVLHIPGGAA